MAVLMLHENPLAKLYTEGTWLLQMGKLDNIDIGTSNLEMNTISADVSMFFVFEAPFYYMELSGSPKLVQMAPELKFELRA